MKVSIKSTAAAIAALTLVAGISGTAGDALAGRGKGDVNIINKMIQSLDHEGGHRRHYGGHRKGWRKGWSKYPSYKHKRHYHRHYGDWKDPYWDVRSHRYGSVDLQVFFRFGSAQFTHRAYRVLDSIGYALTSRRLRHSYFIVGGHTDAVGSYESNDYLSERRAEAVKRYLVDEFDIDPERLISIGYGETRLAFPHHPEAAANRRVEITRISAREARRLRHAHHRRDDEYGDYED